MISHGATQATGGRYRTFLAGVGELFNEVRALGILSF